MQKEDKKRHHHTKMKEDKRHQYLPCMMVVIVSLGNIKEG
jgi:hypothetical protein